MYSPYDDIFKIGANSFLMNMNNLEEMYELRNEIATERNKRMTLLGRLKVPKKQNFPQGLFHCTKNIAENDNVTYLIEL